MDSEELREVADNASEWQGVFENYALRKAIKFLRIRKLAPLCLIGMDLPAKCNEGASNLTLDCPTAFKLLAQIRRAPGAEQLQVLAWLVKKFPSQAEELLRNLNK